MTNKEKKEYYESIKRKIAQDGKTHSSIITSKGIVIDGKLHTLPREIVEDKSMETRDNKRR